MLEVGSETHQGNAIPSPDELVGRAASLVPGLRESATKAEQLRQVAIAPSRRIQFLGIQREGFTVARISTTVSFDMRAPAFGTPAAQLYGAALDMAAYADRIGVGRIGLMEHHGSEDGYLPQPFVMGGAVAAVTKQ